MNRSRRQLLAALGAGVTVGSAGCVGDDGLDAGDGSGSTSQGEMGTD